MSPSPVIHGLIAKRAEISGIIADLEEQMRQERASLAHIDATIQLFDPDMNPKAIRPVRPAKGRSGLFANGEISRRCREAIRKAAPDPVSAESVVRQAMTDKGLDPEDKVIRQDMIRRFLWAMHRMQVAGIIGKVGMGMGARWTAAAEM
jgi:hypothetical protein